MAGDEPVTAGTAQSPGQDGEQAVGDAELGQVAAGVGTPAVRPRLAASLLPLKDGGPTLNAKGGGDVAMETLTITHEALEP